MHSAAAHRYCWIVSATTKEKVSSKFKAHLHNDLVSADTLILLVVMSYLEPQSVHVSQKNITRINHLKGYFSNFHSGGACPPGPHSVC